MHTYDSAGSVCNLGDWVQIMSPMCHLEPDTLTLPAPLTLDSTCLSSGTCCDSNYRPVCAYLFANGASDITLTVTVVLGSAMGIELKSLGDLSAEMV